MAAKRRKRRKDFGGGIWREEERSYGHEKHEEARKVGIGRSEVRRCGGLTTEDRERHGEDRNFGGWPQRGARDARISAGGFFCVFCDFLRLNFCRVFDSRWLAREGRRLSSFLEGWASRGLETYGVS